jgi:hypothetical protein
VTVMITTTNAAAATTTVAAIHKTVPRPRPDRAPRHHLACITRRRF